MATTLSVSDPKQMLHVYQQVIAYGQQEAKPDERLGDIKFVATITAQVFSSTAKVLVDFKVIESLPRDVTKNLKARFRSHVEGVPAKSFAYHQVDLPLRTLNGLSPHDQKESLSRTAEHTYHFPLVNKVVYFIECFDPDSGLTKEEGEFVGFVKEVTKKRFPNAKESRDHVMWLRDIDIVSSDSESSSSDEG